MSQILDKVLMQILNNVLTIDPGDHTGWAYWTGTIYPDTGHIDLSHAKSIITLEDQLTFMWKAFSGLLDNLQPFSVYIEGVEYWEGSFKSVTAAKRQNLSKLAYLVGGYANEARRRGMQVYLPPAREWKGQMSNSILESKVLRLLNKSYPSEHILNAVGIGLSQMGILQNTEKSPQRFKKHKRRDIQW